MVWWAMSYWKTMRKNRKGKYLCAVGTPTCHMSQPPPLFALSVFSPSVFFSAVYLCVSSRMCLSSIFVSGRREGQLVSGGRAVSHWVRWLRLRWEEEESKRGGEPRETELLLSPPLSPALWKYVSKYKDTHICVNIWEHNRELDWHKTQLTFTCVHTTSLVVAIATVNITALKAGNNNLIIIIENLDKYFTIMTYWLGSKRKRKQNGWKHCQRHDGLKHCIE